MMATPRAIVIAVGAAYCGIEVAVFLVADFGSGDDAMAVAAVVGPGVACGFIIGRWPTVALGLIAIPSALFDRPGELTLGFAITALLIVNVAALAAGVALSHVWNRLSGELRLGRRLS